METKHKTLDKLYIELKRRESMSDFSIPTETVRVYLDEVYAELYTKQTKQSEPVSLEVEEAAREYAKKQGTHDKSEITEHDFIQGVKWQSQQPLKLSQIAFSEPYQNLQREYAQLKQKLESQQPASVAFLSDSDIMKIAYEKFPELPNETISKQSRQEKARDKFMAGMHFCQSELRKRVIDPVEFTEWFINNRYTFDSQLGKFFSESYINSGCLKSELLQIYINSKTK